MVRVEGGTVELGAAAGGPRGPRGPVPGGPLRHPGGSAPGHRPGGPPTPGPAPGLRAGAGTPPPPGPLETWQHRDGQRTEALRVNVAPFFLDTTEVTRAAYARFVNETGYRLPIVDEDWARDGWNWEGGLWGQGPARPPDGTATHPVVLTSWYDAQEYCLWAKKRLPTEAEWQLAMLGRGQGRTYPWGDAYDGMRLNHGKIEQPNFDDSDGFLTTSPVGSFPAGATPDGVLDGFGNAWEWVADLRFEDSDHFRDGKTHPPGLYAAVRGGSYFFDLQGFPAGERNGFLTEIRRKTSGFRCARDAG